MTIVVHGNATTIALAEKFALPVSHLVLHPRWTKRGGRYDVHYLGVLIVVGANDPEHAAARALLASGITGRAETVDANTGLPRLRFDIEHFAATRTVERDVGGLSTEPWRPRPSEISQGRSQSSDSDAGGGKVAGRPVRASVSNGGSAA